MATDFARRFTEAWQFTRGLTLDLLENLDGTQLEYSPGPGLGPWWKQFRHVGSIQECYVAACVTGRARFGFEGRGYSGGPDATSLARYLRALDAELARVVDAAAWQSLVLWGETPVDLFEHLSRLVCHETLHHGQWIVYARLLGKALPPSWRAWGV